MTPKQSSLRILMPSLHGYVAAHPELGMPDTGGQVLYVLELARRFAKLGHRVDLVTRRFESQPQYDRINDKLKVWRIPYGGKGFIRKEDMHDHLNTFVQHFTATCGEKGITYDIAFSHYWDAGWAAQKLADQWNVPHVHVPHSLGWWKRKIMPGKEADKERNFRFKERIEKEYLVYKMCDRLVATTHEQADLIEREYDLLRDSMAVIPPGIDEGRFLPVPRTVREQMARKYKLGPRTVLALGRMASNKGYDLLIRAMPTLLKLVPPARLIAAFGSDNSDKDRNSVDKLRELARDVGVDKKIDWRGYVPDDELAAYYQGSGVFALCSRYEPFGMTAIEAMACGTPTVVTVHGGLFRLVHYGTSALYADPKRPMEFGVNLAMPMLHPSLHDRLSSEGARFARRHFGWTGIAEKMIALFHECIENQRRNRPG